MWYLVVFGLGTLPVLIRTETKEFCEQIKTAIIQTGHKTEGCQRTEPKDWRKK